ncbi:cytochrome c oxidase subunit 2A [Chitinophaga caeni]|nr:cytochrome c oxidase subunit 2A [Chitinophaga caeni]
MNSQQDNGEKFVPKGAIAFFVLLIALCLGIWYGIYLIMLQRA